MISIHFCLVCGAANEPEQEHCFACGQPLISAIHGANKQDGTLFHGRYQLGATLGSGGFSAVYRARDIQAERDVAIKQITLSRLSREEVIEATTMFNREVSLLSSLHHPQVPQLYEYFSDPNHRYLVLEYLAGSTLETYLEMRTAQGQPIQVDEVLAMALQICTVLEYLHTRQPPIIFRDLKPGNIIRAPSGKLSLIDFGIARQFRPGKAHDTQPFGSPGYAAPEQYGRAQTTPQSDIYSLGALLHALLSGQDPSEQLQGLAPLRLNLLPELTALTQRMLSADPGERPASVREVADELKTIRFTNAVRDAKRIWRPPTPQLPAHAGGQLPSSSKRAAPPPAKRRLKRRRVLAGLCVLAAVGSSGMIWRQNIVANSPYIYKGHTDAVNAVAWSSDGSRIASASSDGTVQVWNASNGNDVFTYRGHTGAVSAVAWSPDGKCIASVSIDGTVRIWDAKSGGVIAQYSGGNTVAWSPDSTHIASASSDNSAATVWDVNNSRHIFTYQGHYAPVTSIAWSPDGKRIVSGSDDMSVQVWDAYDGSNVTVYRDHTDVVNAVAWSPDSTAIASASRDTTVRVASGSEGNAVYRGHSASVNAVGWSSYFTFIASGSDDQTVQVWHSDDSGRVFTYRGHTDAVSTVMWSPDGKRLASGSWDRTVQVWEVPH